MNSVNDNTLVEKHSFWNWVSQFVMNKWKMYFCQSSLTSNNYLLSSTDIKFERYQKNNSSKQALIFDGKVFAWTISECINNLRVGKSVAMPCLSTTSSKFRRFIRWFIDRKCFTDDLPIFTLIFPRNSHGWMVKNWSRWGNTHEKCSQKDENSWKWF